ncbi:adenylosuccinate lyase [Paracoccus marinus]|uniref:adenylosuccinate lyase n=1 Tax=Paracoccus marinus TaxID=288426 RepID=UPI00117F9EE4|nr:adenylosuccinate lyase [Paracoccus marinus]GLS80590.1 hypothetical protein GCM10007893_13780 [Paracoccus marinus]
MTPGFSERAFEFCYNHTYVQRNAAIIATYPHIPSQRQEKTLGYDVEFRITQGNFSYMIFIQHKVSHYAERRAGKNAAFYNRYNAPYYRFRVDNDQHQRLQELSRARGNTFYCAPLFYSRNDLHENFQNDSIIDSVVLLDPLDVGPAVGPNHNITYDAAGGNATMHSQPQRFERSFTGDVLKIPSLRKAAVTSEEVRAQADLIFDISANVDEAREVRREYGDLPRVQQAQILLGQVYGVTWLII